MSDDLDRLLALIDETPLPDAEALAAEDRVWARITGAEAAVAVTRVVDDSGRASGREHRVRRRWVLSAAAAAVLVLAGLVGLGILTGGEQSPADVPATTVPSPITAPLDRTEACSAYQRDGVAFAELDAVVLAADVELLDRALAELDVLDGALAALDVGQPELDALAQVRGGLAQAQLMIETGDEGAALGALEFATTAYSGSGLFDERCLG